MTETPTQRLDRALHTAAAPLTGGLSPVSLALAMADWGWHLAASPGRQLELASLAGQLALDTWRQQDDSSHDAHAGAHDDDPRFRDEAWARWPWSQLRAGFRNTEAFWREASQVPGVSAHHAQMTRFFAQQWLAMLAPANGLLSNPVVLQDALASRGSHLAQGLRHWVEDASGSRPPSPRYAVGKDVAITPGQVVHRNPLVELIRYEAQTRQVHAAPVFIVPSWIMKYYILDLSPHNSLVRYLVSRGHTVYMVSWRNPDAEDHGLSMDDYLRLGVLDPMQAIGQLQPQAPGLQAMGYCLGGTLLAIAAAALARAGSAPLLGHQGLPALRSLTLLAAQTDFSEPGELGLFIDESQIGLLDELTRGKGYLSGQQMAGSFQFLHSRALVWTRRMREYLMGEREQPNDLMAWNADTTRMPARMHHEYLTALYLHNALAASAYRVDGRTVSLSELRMPVFLVGTERDHVSPWRSVYKLHHLCATDITFALASGGHNAGIISEPGHAHRSYRIGRRPEHGNWQDADEWLAEAAQHEGSWWPAWADWLGRHGGRKQPAVAGPAPAALGPAPGQYVMQRYPD